ncbi:MBL fold metallo-hydrolase [Candidatus Bathyarchaeota archaeon]|nr:MBL fold metallo-hydrolase [Candidatus Bathyarchaeota archaeon]
MIVELGRYDSRLRHIFLLEGYGLSSNIFVLGKNIVTLVDTGVGNAPNRIVPKLIRIGLDPEKIQNVILTHVHLDHVGGLLEIAKFRPKTFIHPNEFKLLEKTLHQKFKTLLKQPSSTALEKAPFTFVENGETITLEGRSLRVIHTPGHTSGSICLYDEANQILFSGDTVFPGGSFGRTDLPTGDSKAMMESLKHLLKLEVESLLPGHGDPVIRKAAQHVRLAAEAVSTLL